MNGKSWRWLVLSAAMFATLSLVACKTTPPEEPAEEPSTQESEPVAAEVPREVTLRVCDEGECDPCEGSTRGVEVSTDISEQLPVECDWDAERRTCTNEGARLAFVLEAGDGERTLEILEKPSSHSPGAWTNQYAKGLVRDALVTEPAANLSFREDGTTDWQYEVRVSDQDGPMACVDPIIFIHERPIG